MPATPIVDPTVGESLVGTEPQLKQQLQSGVWRQRLNLFTGRTLSASALSGEQAYRGGMLGALGRMVTAGTVSGLVLSMEANEEDPALTVAPGYGILADGQDVVLNQPLKTHLSTLPVIDATTGVTKFTFRQSVGDPTNKISAGILLLQPVIAQVSGQAIDTGADRMQVSGTLNASCGQDPAEYAFEDWQIADGVQLVYLPWPDGVPALPLPNPAPAESWRNRLAYAIFEAESLLGPDEQLPWASLGLPVGLIAFDPGVQWQASTAFAAGQFFTDPNSNLQMVQTAGTTGATEPGTWNQAYGGTTTDGGVTWMNNGFAWKPLFVDRSAVVRAGGLPRNRFEFPAVTAPSRAWQPNTMYVSGDFIVDGNNNIQLVQTAGKSGGPPPVFAVGLGTTTADGAVTWVQNGPATWKTATAFAAGQFLFDSNGNLQHVQVAGTSGGSEPVWNAVFLPTTDGSVTWVNNGSGNPPIIQRPLAEARIRQFSEQLTDALTGQQNFSALAPVFPTMPPSGILPAEAVNFEWHRATWLPRNWKVTAAPVRLQELEAALETGMRLELLPAQNSVPADPSLIEPVELLVPLPDEVYDPKILVTETVSQVFEQELTKATAARNSTLQRLQTVQSEMNMLNGALGPNAPVNASLIDTDAGLTADEVQGRNLPPPYLPTVNEMFGTQLQATWAASASYATGAFVVDTNGAVQTAQVGGTTGAAAPAWNANVQGTTTDGDVTWLNNGSWAWQPNTAYMKGQFVLDATGGIQTVTQDGTSASTVPAWPGQPVQGQTTQDGIVWLCLGNDAWQADFPFEENQAILDSNGNVQVVQSAGISGDAPPEWNGNQGQTTQDSSVTWMNLGAAGWSANIAFAQGQAIIDSNGFAQRAQVGGTSGANPPQWNDQQQGTTLDSSITWTNTGSVAWGAGKAFTAGQLIVDPNGHLQLATIVNADGNPSAVGTAGTSGPVPPNWSTTPGGITQDGGIRWQYLSFYSSDLVHLRAVAASAPYTRTFKDAAGNDQTLKLLSDSDQANLETNGLQVLAASLSDRISRANDLLDTAFLTCQTDIYRYRQNILGAQAATTLATSPILANIAQSASASATANDLQTYINKLQPPPSATTNYTPPSPIFSKPVIRPIQVPVVFGAQRAQFQFTKFNTAPNVQNLRMHALNTQMDAVKELGVLNEPSATLSGSVANMGSLSGRSIGLTDISLSQSGNLFSKGTTELNLGNRLGEINQVSLVGDTFTGGAASMGTAQTGAFAAAATTTDITNQSPLAGAQLELRTLTVAERLKQSPSQEAMFYSIANRLSFMQALQALEEDLNIVADDIPILVDGTPAADTTVPQPVPVETHRFSEWMNVNNRPALMARIQTPALAADMAEATAFSVGIRVLEQHSMLLRALEARVQEYANFLTLCRNAINNIQSSIQSAANYVGSLQNTLHQNRQDVAFISALLADETQRVSGVNAQRQQVLSDSVHLVVYTRARTLQAMETAPSRQLEPANIANPVPACIQQSVAIPPELRELIGQLREAPVNWMPSIAALVPRLERPILLQQLALSAQVRATQALQFAALPSSASGETGVYSSTVATLYHSNQKVFRSFQMQRSAFQPSSLMNLSWATQVSVVQNAIAINDLISAEAVHAEISNAVARLIQQISGVATCLYTRASAALPIERLGWAEYLRKDGLSVQLQSLSILPGWNQMTYSDRQQMQMIADWLFGQIDSGNGSAVAFMSDVVRTAILLASDVPVDNIIPAGILQRVRPEIGGMVSLTLNSARAASGMYVNLYSAGSLAARAVVSDLDSASVRATVTDVFKPGVFLEANDTAHLTTQAPLALAMRALQS